MITSADNPPWPQDCLIANLAAAGLPHPSRLRFKLFTLDNRLVRGGLGRLARGAGQGARRLTSARGVAGAHRNHCRCASRPIS